MSKVGNVSGTGAMIAGGSLGRFIPEPKSSAGLSFGGVLKSLGGLASGVAGSVAGINPEYMDLLQKQMEVQTQMQLISMHSNIEKSKHETEMAAIRNIRVG